MILSRVIEHVKHQNWTAVFLDFVIVVAGVFMGLQVQEWSAARADRNTERAALERLIVEYETNLQLLADEKTKAERALAATGKLLSMIAPQPDPGITDEGIAQTLIDCLTSPKFVPALGVTNSLAASGDLRLIDDPEIQRMLTQWPVTAQNLIEWQEIERNHGEELIFGLTTEYVAWPTLESLNQGTMEPSTLTSDYRGLFSSRRFAGLLTNRHHNTSKSIRRMDRLSADTTALIERMKMRLAELQRG